VPTPPPDPAQAKGFDDLVERLRLLKVWAGDPSYETIKDRVNAAWTAAGRPAGELVCKSTVAYCFRPGRRRMDTDLVVAVVQALHPDTGYVNQWRQALRVVGGEKEAVTQVRVQDSLPQDLAGFTGRTGELGLLRHAVRGGQAVVISAIEGMAGVGKTQLAVHAGHLLHREKPFERVLFVNLRGFDPAQPPADPAAVLDGFLRLLGMPGQQIPHTLAGRAAAYRDRLAPIRALVVLDNAATTEQIHPLLPATPGCLTLVTSRRSLTDLHPATHLSVDVFTADDAQAFLARAVPEVPLGTDPNAAARIARCCGFLPLALSLIIGHIRNTPGWTLTDHADRLDERHHQRRLDTGVELALHLSYQHLPDDQRRLLRLLALHPGQDFDAYAAAALADTDPATAQTGLDNLHRDHLLQQAAPGRYTFHDLVRAYATTRATDEDPPPARRAALTRLFDYYLASAWTAMDIYYPAERPHRPAPPVAATPIPAFDSSSDALTWLHEERPSLLAVAQHAALHGSPVHAVGLSAVLYRYLDSSGNGTDGLALHSDARQAAIAAGDRHGEALALLGIGTVLMQVCRLKPAVESLTESAEMFRQQNDLIGEGRALNTLGVAHRTGGRLAAAVPYHHAALRLFRRAGEPSGEGHALASLGAAARQLGRSAEAVDYNEQALEVYRRAGDRCGQARALNNLGMAEVELGRLELALGHLEQACAAFVAEGDQRGEASVLDSLGGAYHRLGSFEQAADYFARSVEAFRRIGCQDFAWPLAGLGEIALDQGRPVAALTSFTEVLGMADETGSRLVEAQAHSGVGRAHHALGNLLLAREHCTRALRIFQELEIRDTPQLGKLRAVLADKVS
jgi:tetratricopeptide (TPR) repeat protein